MFVVTGHVWDLVSGTLVSKTVEEVSSEIGTLGSKIGRKSYASLLGGTYFKSINADFRYNYKFFIKLKSFSYFV